MAKCLVTGHRGYIGSKLFENLKQLGHEVLSEKLDEIPPSIVSLERQLMELMEEKRVFTKETKEKICENYKNLLNKDLPKRQRTIIKMTKNAHA